MIIPVNNESTIKKRILKCILIRKPLLSIPHIMRTSHSLCVLSLGAKCKCFRCDTQYTTSSADMVYCFMIDGATWYSWNCTSFTDYQGSG